jgi:hypothetical protein
MFLLSEVTGSRNPLPLKNDRHRRISTWLSPVMELSGHPQKSKFEKWRTPQNCFAVSTRYNLVRFQVFMAARFKTTSYLKTFPEVLAACTIEVSWQWQQMAVNFYETKRHNFAEESHFHFLTCLYHNIGACCCFMISISILFKYSLLFLRECPKHI